MERDKLLRVIGRAKKNDIVFILEKLSEDDDFIEAKMTTTQTVSLSDEEIDLIKDSLLILIKEDDVLLNKVKYIWENDDRTRMADGGLGTNEMIVIVTGLSILGVIANNLIKSITPNKEKFKDGEKEYEVERGYSSVSETLKNLASLVKDKIDK